MRAPTIEDCRLEPGLKGQPGGSFYWFKKKKKKAVFFKSLGVASRAGADRVWRCQQNPAATHKYQDKEAGVRLSSEEAVHAGCQSDCVNARPLPAGAMMDER